jgi:hypothetical protein
MSRLENPRKSIKKTNPGNPTLSDKSSSKNARCFSPHPKYQTQTSSEPVVPDGTNIPSSLSSPHPSIPHYLDPSPLPNPNEPNQCSNYKGAKPNASSSIAQSITPHTITPNPNSPNLCAKTDTSNTVGTPSSNPDNNSSHNIIRQTIDRNTKGTASKRSKSKGTTNSAKTREPQDNGSDSNAESNSPNITSETIGAKKPKLFNNSNNLKPYRDLPTHPLENESIDKHYATLTLSIIKSLYKKDCGCDAPNLMFFKVKSRPTVARCKSCQKQVSITSNTPLHKFLLPLSYFSYILHDAILQYPKVMTSAEISRKLNLPFKTAYLLKRRIQIVASQLSSKMRESVKAQLSEYVEANPIELPKGEDLRPLLENYPVASSDAVVLYSSSVKANKYRSRRFRTGSSSIYRSNNLGGDQVGTMVHTIGIKGSYTFYKSIPLTKQEYLYDDLATVVPREVPLFTDEGYKFIWDRKNHRMVNHSKRSKDPRLE